MTFEPLPERRDAAGQANPAPRSFVRQYTLLECARMTRRARAKHSDTFPKGVFRDRAWDIMIELFIAAGEGRSLCMKDAMLIAEDSLAGSVRRVDALEEAGLVERRPDPDDHRRVIVSLSEAGTKAMTSFLRDMYRLESPIAEPPVAAPRSFSPAGRAAPRGR